MHLYRYTFIEADAATNDYHESVRYDYAASPYAFDCLEGGEGGWDGWFTRVSDVIEVSEIPQDCIDEQLQSPSGYRFRMPSPDRPLEP